MKKVLFVFAIAAAFAACNDAAKTETPKVDSVVAKVDTAMAKVDTAVKKLDSTVKAAVDTAKKAK